MPNLKEKIIIGSSKYILIHNWIYKHYGKAIKCEGDNCNDKSINYNWSLKKGYEYDYNRDNFIPLCVSCHRKYDITDDIINRFKQNKGRKMSDEHKRKISKNHKLTGLNKIPVLQYSVDNELIKIWDSITDASKELKILRTAINNCLNNRSKTAGNFIWKYQTLT